MTISRVGRSRHPLAAGQEACRHCRVSKNRKSWKQSPSFCREATLRQYCSFLDIVHESHWPWFGKYVSYFSKIWEIYLFFPPEIWKNTRCIISRWRQNMMLRGVYSLKFGQFYPSKVLFCQFHFNFISEVANKIEHGFDLVHNCTLFLCSLDVENEQCRGPSIKEKDHLIGLPNRFDPLPAPWTMNIVKKNCNFGGR